MFNLRKLQNRDIVQVQRGVMYFGNNDGLPENDGVSRRLIKPPSVYAIT
jgi:hypothetical protein